MELKRLELPTSIEEWLEQALQYPGVHLLDLTPRIAVEATQLPGAFHRDPADQLIVATSRVHGIQLATADRKILEYVEGAPRGVSGSAPGGRLPAGEPGAQPPAGGS